MRKALVLVSLAIIIGLAVFVSARMIPTSSDGFNYNIEVSVEKGWNLVLITPIMGVYQGDDYADDYLASDSEIKRENIKAVYYLLRGQNKYLQIYPSAQEFINYRDNLPNEDINYVLFNSVWIYSDKAGILKYSRIDVPKYDSIALEDGWNFLTITPELKGLTYSEIKGSCNIEKVCVFQRQNWECATGTELMSHTVEDTDANIGTGIVMKVTQDCALGASSNVPSVPQLP